MEEEHYMGLVKKKLEESGVEIGDLIRVRRSDGFSVEGRVLPRYMMTSPDVVVLKLSNGYNIGVKIDEDSIVEKIAGKRLMGPVGAPAPLKEVSEKAVEKKVYIIGTGGTIASRIDYSTGAVYPYISTDELLQAVPELYEIADIEVVELFNIFSEDMTPFHWKKLAEKIADLFSENVEGIVVAHGTDTMAYTAAAMAFAFGSTMPGPIVLTGSQRSSDRPSSDSAFNIISATLMASNSIFRESMVVMHGTTGDHYSLAHRGVRVRKMHTSRRDAFQSINDLPLAIVYPYKKQIKVITRPLYSKPYNGRIELKPEFEDKVALIKHYPGMDGELIDMLLDKGYRGIVIEGTGFGHVSSKAIESIKRAVNEKVPIIITSQCLFGRVNLHVYSTGRLMLKAGAIPAEDMIPETAYVKLSWMLGQGYNYDEIRKNFAKSMVGETGNRTLLRTYPRWYHGED